MKMLMIMFKMYYSKSKERLPVLKKVSLLFLSVLLVFSWGIINVHAQTSNIDANSVQQYIRGFGAANIIGWRDDITSADRTTAFSVTNGLGLSVLRVRVSPNSGDWSSNQATINAAKSNGAMVIASAWSAPASMKTNNNTTGGNLKSSSYADYASHLRNFCNTVGGVDAISPINEPNITVDYESMEMSASDVAAFVAAQGGNCGAPIMAPEPYNMSQSYINEYLSNSGAKSNTTYICGHIYGATPSSFNPGKEVWMTEIIVDSDTNGNDWNKAMTVAKQIHDCMNAGYSMYVWWYIKRYYGPIEEDGTITKTGYVMAQFSKWVRPGFNRISCTANPTSNVYTTAYKKGSDLVIVAVNRNSSTSSVNFNLSGLTVSGFTTHTTTGSSNLASGSVSASGSSFSVSLPGSSITTMVSGGGSQVTPDPTTPPADTPTPTPVESPGPTPTPNQNPIWSGGPYSLNGSSSSYVELPDGITGDLYDFSIACWVKLNSLDTWSRIFDFGGDTNVFMMLTPASGNTGYPYFCITTSGNDGEQGINGTGALPTGSWQHLAVTRSGNTGILYINTQEVGRNAGMTLHPADMGNTTNNYIGRSQWSADPYLNADIDGFVVYNRALSAQEVSALGGTPPGGSGDLGDANGSGAIDIVDALIIAQYYVGLDPSGFIAANADTNCDGSINIVDALLVAQYYVGLINRFC
jgi:glucuronoarabinoxylan endo-1,4-beta-xylanase